MMRKPIALAMIALLTACGGGGAGASLTPVAAPHLPTQNTVSIRVVVPTAGASTSSRLRHILDVAASTQSGSVTPYLSTDTSRTSPLESPQAFSLAAGSPNCTATAGTSGRVCTFSVTIPSEPATVSLDLILRTYDGPIVGGAVSGTQIGAGFTTMAGPAPGATPSVNFTLGSVVSKVTLSMPTTTLHQILASNTPLYFSAQDADGNAIVSTAYTDALGNPATITLNATVTTGGVSSPSALLIGVGTSTPLQSVPLTTPPTQALYLQNVGSNSVIASGQTVNANVALVSGSVASATLPLTIIPWSVTSIAITNGSITPTFSPSNYTPGSVAITNKLVADSSGGPYLYFADQDTTQFNIWTATISGGTLTFAAFPCATACTGIGSFGALSDYGGTLYVNTTGSTTSAAVSLPVAAGVPNFGSPTSYSSTYGFLHGGSAAIPSGGYLATGGSTFSDYIECAALGTTFTETPLYGSYAPVGNIGDILIDPSGVAWFADGSAGVGTMGVSCGTLAASPIGGFAGPVARLAIQPSGIGASAHELVWATEPSNGQSQALDTVTNTIVATDVSGGNPSAIVYDNGYLWVADPNPSSPGLHHDATSGAPSYATQQNFYAIGSSHIDAMTLGADGALYALDTATATIYRVTY